MSNKNFLLTFFENIYYWLWYYSPRSKHWHHPAPAFACTLLSTFKILNLFWILILISAIVKNNIAIQLFGDSKFSLIIGALIVGFFLVRKDEKKYEERIETICSKVEFLTRRERNIKKFIFFFYIIISLAVWGIADTLVAQYK